MYSRQRRRPPAVGFLRENHQLGVQVRGGAERIAMLTRQLRSEVIAVWPLDLRNAFNSVDLNCVVRAVAQKAPQLLAYVVKLLADPTALSMASRCKLVPAYRKATHQPAPVFTCACGRGRGCQRGGGAG